MSSFLIIYSSTDGHTKVICERIKNFINDGNLVELASLEEAKNWGGNIYPIECLNTKEDWCKDFAKYTFIQAEGSAQDKEDIEYKLDKKFYEKMPQQVMNKS